MCVCFFFIPERRINIASHAARSEEELFMLRNFNLGDDEIDLGEVGKILGISINFFFEFVQFVTTDYFHKSLEFYYFFKNFSIFPK